MSEVIVITSGKGGVGKTTTTANVGTGLAQLNKKVVLIDTDIGLRNLDVVMGLENRIVYNLVDVVEGNCRIKQALIKDKKYPNAMRNSDAQEARTESERALQQVIFSIMADNMELFKQFQDNPSFKKWLSDLVFNLTYNPEGKEYIMPSQETLMVAEDPAMHGNKKDEE